MFFLLCFQWARRAGELQELKENAWSPLCPMTSGLPCPALDRRSARRVATETPGRRGGAHGALSAPGRSGGVPCSRAPWRPGAALVGLPSWVPGGAKGKMLRRNLDDR